MLETLIRNEDPTAQLLPSEEVAKVQSVVDSSSDNRLAGPHNLALIGELEHFKALETLVNDEYYPEAPESRTLPHLQALLDSINSVRRRPFLNAWREMADDNTIQEAEKEAAHGSIPDLITLDELVKAAYDLAGTTIDDNTWYTSKSIKPEFRNHIVQFLQDDKELLPGQEQFDLAFDKLADLTIPSPVMISCLFGFMNAQGMINKHSLLLIYGPTFGSPHGHMRLIGNSDPDVPITPLYAHNPCFTDLWQLHGFVESGEGKYYLWALGLHPPGTATIKPASASDTKQSTAEDPKRDNAIARRILKGCKACIAQGKFCISAGDKFKRTDRRYGSCEELDIHCEWASHQNPISGPKKLGEVISADIKSHLQRQEYDEEMREESDADSQSLWPPNEMIGVGQDWYRTYIMMRKSTHPGAATFAQLVARVPIIRQTLMDFYNELQQMSQEATAPPGVMQTLGVVWVRPGVRAIPTRISKHIPLPLVNFVLDLHNNVLNAKNPPTRIQFLTMGIAGGSVPLTGFGTYFSGVYKEVMDFHAANGTNLAHRIDLITVVEPRVANGGPEAMAHILNTMQHDPNRPGYQNKYVHKNTLWELLREYYRMQREAVQDFQAQAAGLPPPWRPPITAHRQRLRNHIMALEDDGDWRDSFLDATTVPTDDEVQRRNRWRNREWA